MARTVASVSLAISSRTEYSSIPMGSFLPAGMASASGAAAVAARNPRREMEPCDLMPKNITRSIRKRNGSILGAAKVNSPIHLPRAGTIVFGTLVLFSALYAFQRPFREYPGVEYEKYPLPRD